MATVEKFLKVSSVSRQDMEDLFNAICDRVVNMTPTEIKRKILQLEGTKKDLEDFEPTILSILTIVAAFGIKMEFTIFYTDDDGKKREIPIAEKIDVIKKEMAEQEKIVAPEILEIQAGFSGGKKIEIVEVIHGNVIPKRNEDDMPDFD